MDSDDDTFDNVDSGNVSSGEDDFPIVDEVEMSCSKDRQSEHDEYPYEGLTTEEIVQHMVDCIKEVNTVVEIPATTLRILLNHFKWDKEKLMEKYYDGDQEAFFREAHVINPFNKPVAVTRPKLKRSGTEECEICFSNFPPSMMTGLECGHKFCTHCWGEYLTTKIMEEGLGQSISCAAHGCDIIVDDVTVMKLVNDSRVRLKYQHLITNSFVECNRLLRWCPSADCSYAVKVAYVESRPVACKCGHVFCFECGENWHDPVLCKYLKKWIKKCDDDSETSNWIAANTKECPKCNVTIEKDGGCNHMVCKNQNCKHDFCWVCLGSWEPHGSSWYNCNRYDEDEAKAARDAQEKLRSSLARYLHYYNRYMNHMQSLKFEHKLYNCIKEKMEEMQQHNMSWIEVQFLKRAVDILVQCRQTLMCTYVFAYYLRKNNQSLIFEANQKDLETATEKLSEYLERDITSENLADIKQKVQDKYRYCEKRRKVLLDHVHEGYENDWWIYTE
ncbi:E3 ubiquitin-protein ligase ariadne-1 [Sitodiplosis mosellana]|uniref:E3 ubiquitin-protein ligase ariadne-1 n=1 Tax=Sitodiplosis mosellana TaxID=263140 RepID=UPI002444D27E|nr:E3 ubiquitin-protein ligase ariadne-1 [Sitodiplosis mosellana]XP_055325962.1 E3 ubiquitin-protein ligase ariadne-1 [Sitodiplosis mosellana]XP_055326034.1 E3 ubiquitin-protein ligase ariadne-1 [Sitodiplosis mosellana]XP_055326111.1 E3 ubiquitin-protein ligase ariadne-1 [Sitodiplosis mosellana]XP_055326176.1 E3 ubiquitin-protein ligase ariadne-1 [Sitodiplosis mosellana]XP_055326237.1 E3 ubiquitin-protein ligase ariadne-1 [Sitodiplosis mosellana]XP_055326309.1 E3 ubiquitin-protein ligase aria